MYVKYNSLEHGQGTGQVIDVIEKDNKTIVICEKLYSKKDLRDREREDSVIALGIGEVTISQDEGLSKRMRFR